MARALATNRSQRGKAVSPSRPTKTEPPVPIPEARARARREAVFERMRATHPASALLLPAAALSTRNGDVVFPYRQDSDFYSLTAFEEPGALALFMPGHAEHRFVLYVPPRNPEREVWDGVRAGVEGARERFGADFAAPFDKAEETLNKYLETVDRIYYPFGRNHELDARLMRVFVWLRQTRPKRGTGALELVDPTDLLHELRLRKSPHEIATLRRAAAITIAGHEAAMRVVHPGIPEYEVVAEIEYAFRRRGSPSWGYPTIVGSGPNATVLHYQGSTRVLGAGELVLIDAGAELDYLSADITRTLPVSGRFSKEQRALYDIVLAAQEAAIDAAVVGREFTDIHKAATRVLAEGLCEVGLLACTASEAWESQAFLPYYMHQTSHWLGMDVHDAGLYRVADPKGLVEVRPLEGGMVLTVEPGLYIRDDVAAPKGVAEVTLAKYRGIGIRIEDDVLVTADGPDLITGALPKRAVEIERLCAKSPRSR